MSRARFQTHRSRRAALLAAVATSLFVTTADADLEGICGQIYEQSQELMKPKSGESSLLPAREMLRTCVRSSCKEWVVSDCAKWLAEVEARIPTVVLSAKNTAGRDLTDVTVTVEGGGDKVLRIDGHAIEMEPGERTFVFVTPDGTRQEKRVLIREGEKTQSIAALFDAPPGELPPAALGPREAPVAPRPSNLRYAGYASVGLGAVGLGLGTVFGLRAMAKKDTARCDGTGGCEDGAALAEADSAATTSTVAFVAGGALVAAGIALVVLAPSSSPVKAFRLGPSFRTAGAGFELGGRW